MYFYVCVCVSEFVVRVLWVAEVVFSFLFFFSFFFWWLRYQLRWLFVVVVVAYAQNATHIL